jgi:hypothetical protein
MICAVEIGSEASFRKDWSSHWNVYRGMHVNIMLAWRDAREHHVGITSAPSFSFTKEYQ